LNPVYKKYKPKGFEIYSVFIGDNKTHWLNAVKIDKLNWIQVSDLNYKTPLRKLYNLPDDIFKSYLIDKEGKIIEVDISIEGLDKKLNELL